MNTLAVLGIMSGTSIDGVDFAICSVGSSHVELRSLWGAKFPGGLQARLHNAATGRAGAWEVAQLHHDLGRFYATHAAQSRSKLRPALIGLHGQTIFHNPDPRAPATLQLGEPAYLAERFRVPIVSNLRASDLAAGGQGAPLATAFHLRAFGRRGEHVCVNNLGGISNVTSIDWRRGAKPVVRAFDTGPANVLLDLAMVHVTRGRLRCDKNGAWAARGRPCPALLAEWLKHPFFRKAPPKSTGREMFGESFLRAAFAAARRRKLSRFDLLATLTEFTASSLAGNYVRHIKPLPHRVILCGGGAANPVLVRAIEEALHRLNPAIVVQTSQQLGWPLQSVEPAAFAYLAWLRWHNQPGNLPATTGARRAVLCGQISN